MIGRRGFLASLLGLVAAPFVARLPPIPAPARTVPVVYSNRTFRKVTDLAGFRDYNVLLSMDDYAGVPTLNFRGIPIHVRHAPGDATEDAPYASV
jgi:hypothetical protein